MNIAILSTAHIHTRSFLSGLAGHPDGRRACALWDDNTGRAQGYAREFGVAFEPDLERLLADSRVDGFIICAENTRHLSLLEKVIPLGKPVMCEKPLTTSLSDLGRVRLLLEEFRTPLVCGYFHFFLGRYQSARALVDEGSLGKVTRAGFRNAHHAAYGRWFEGAELDWFTRPELSGGGALMDMGTHALHLLISLFGEVDSVWATVGNHSGIYPEVEDYGIAHLRFKSGILGEIEAAWTQTGGRTGLEIVGSRATLNVDAQTLRMTMPDKEPSFIAPLDALPDRVDRLVAVWRGEVSLEAQADDLNACLHAVEVMAAAYASAASGSWAEVAGATVSRSPRGVARFDHPGGVAGEVRPSIGGEDR